MKRLINLLSIMIVLVMVSTCLFACAPDHEHDFVEVSTTATCLEGGKTTFECSICGKKKTESVDALGHRYEEDLTKRTVTCTKKGKMVFVCECGDKYEENVEALGHNFGDDKSFSRIPMCQNPGCKVYGSFPRSDSDFRKQVKYTFSEDDKARIDGGFESLKDTLASFEKYDATKHAYEEDSELFTKNASFEESFLAWEEEIYYVIAQYQYAKILYDVDFSDVTVNEQLRQDSLEISNYYDEVLADYNSLFPLVHETELREYFFYGMTEEEIADLLEETENASNPELVELSKRNNEIEKQYDEIKNPEASSLVLDLYAEFVENNNRIAQIKGYDNYMEYAYERIYGREYTPEQSAGYYANVVKYIAPLFKQYEEAWSTNQDKHYGSNQYTNFANFYDGSFFSTYDSNHAVNDFFTVVKTKDADGNEISYYDIFNELMETKNYFRGDYEGAYSWWIQELETPILYFGTGSDSGNTVVHEFGHYANELKNHDNPQSFDLSETHSQGLEVLYMSYLNENRTGHITSTVYDLYSSITMVNNLFITCVAAGVDAFERAVYTNSYDGPGADKIMADGKITKDEYDKLFIEIMNELGCSDYSTYWRQVTIRSAGYYISYSVSMACSLQLFSDGTNFDEKVQSYLKLVNYSDVEEQIEFNYKQVLEYAGLLTYDDEEMFKYISKVFTL